MAAETLIEVRGPGDLFWPAVEPESGWLLLLRASRRRDDAPTEVWRTFVGEGARDVFDWMTTKPDHWRLGAGTSSTSSMGSIWRV